MVIPSYSLYDFGPRNENEPTLQQTVEHVHQQAKEQIIKLQTWKEQYDVSAAALHKLVAEANETAHTLMHTSLQVAHKVLLQRSATSKEKCEAAQESKDLAEKADLLREILPRSMRVERTAHTDRKMYTARTSPKLKVK
ncbi:unnamed protein product [Zymoseptoria tritici ST99CH_1A5]|uniref:Uncharacterized protein n=1 Tax=Zymoseptoria tritici ST99CH_1A5 TaxID=1276529 RepID=A0A1Y6LIC8_ZYMTR|nr:unnamed protein product [Zymoseptoria tritici ST99CH_1A5]